jgi:uncharacterized protein CbrC (UPF0167 family)
MSEPPSNSVLAGSGELPDVLRTLAGLLPQFQGDALDSQLQTFDVFLGFLAPSVRPQVARLLAQAAAAAPASHVRKRIQAAADSVMQGGRAAEPYDHARAMQEYRESFAKSNPRAYEPIPERSSEPLPAFKYHPDPVATGSVVASDTECECCGQSRGYIYVGPVYGENEYDERICPWCIADGSAHDNLEVSFTDENGVGGYEDAWCAVAEEIVEQVAYRTPGFNGWQQEQWWTHCDDAAEFLGVAGKAELVALGPEAVAAIRAQANMDDEAQWGGFFNSLHKDGSPTAYVFRCRKCAAFGGYHDFD